jgi:hypothetical protein
VKLNFEIEENGEKRQYVFDWQMTVREAMFVQEKAHVSPRDLWPALDRQDPSGVAAFVYIVKRRAGELVKWEDMLDLNLLSFKTLGTEEDEPEADSKNEAVDPPQATGGKTRKAATKVT